MSGGYLEKQSAGGHQVIIFTFIGALKPELLNQWNRLIAELKKEYPDQIIGVTIKGQPTPRGVGRRRAR